MIQDFKFREIWLVDFEFAAPAGGRPRPVCLVAQEFHSGRQLRVWRDELLSLKAPPFSVDAASLFVAYYASAEMGCHLALGWPLPVNVLDLYTEFRNFTNGLPTPCGDGLLGAQAYFGLSCIDVAEKEAMRELAQKTVGWTEPERNALLDYCASDVVALDKLLRAMAPTIDMPRGLLRGRYMRAAGCIEHVGIPIDVATLNRLRNGWDHIQDALIAKVDQDYGVYEGRTFKTARFAEFLARNAIPWITTETGALNLKEDTFREMAKVHPIISPLRELRTSLSQMRLADLAVGEDGRNRLLLSAFRARTGRNQPSNSRFIFGPSAWLRGLIKPEPGRGLAYIDWSQQEFGTAAALSGDTLMQQAYDSGDPYLEFAKQAGAAPPDATKATHKAVREQFKACVLAVQYGMGEESLALRIGQPVSKARELLRLHRSTYRVYWAWNQAAVDHAMLHGSLHTTFGWKIHVGADVNPRSLQNFPMQANGAEMLRLACMLGTEAGIDICAPIHDALLIEAPLERLDEQVAAMQAIMVDASQCVLGGFALRSDAVLVRSPERYMDARGAAMWANVMSLLDQRGADGACPPMGSAPVHACDTPCPPATTRSLSSISPVLV